MHPRRACLTLRKLPEDQQLFMRIQQNEELREDASSRGDSP